MIIAPHLNFFGRILDLPSYGYLRNGLFYKPSHREIFKEFFSRLNFLKSRKNWIPFFSWFTSLSLGIPLFIFLTHYFSWPLLAAGFLYSMVILGSHGTFWLHRYSTHRAFEFRNPLVRDICRNLVIRILPEEVYVISHHVHHQFSEKPGDPYNVHGGFLYCFLADVTHQTVNKNLSEKDYEQLCKLIDHTGVLPNTYTQYQKWGSICRPSRTVVHFVVNWIFWYAMFFMVGGHALALALFGASGVWAFGVRSFNFEGHAKGKDLRREGIDFNRKDLSINQIWPGYVSGEWHNNHHLYSSSARCGFLRYQIDLPWYFIWTLSKMSCVISYRNSVSDFYRDHYNPYLALKKAA